MKILLVEDDKDVAHMIKAGLGAHTHLVDIASDGVEGLFLAKNYDYDAIVLDYSLPKKDGLTVCKEIRAAGKSTPIIFLSATEETEIKVTALNLGADDYLTKPFSSDELYARLKALMRRPATIKRPILRMDDIELDTDSHVVRRGGSPIQLTRKEINLLEYFLNNQGVVLSRALLMEHVWTAESDPFSNTVEAHVRNLRRKINVGGKPDLIANIPGRGYVMKSAETGEK